MGVILFTQVGGLPRRLGVSPKLFKRVSDENIYSKVWNIVILYSVNPKLFKRR